MTTIKGSTNSEGLFLPINPIQPFAGHCQGGTLDEYDKWDKHYPPALCYNQQGELVTGLKDLEVIGPVWQYKYETDPGTGYEWDGCLDNDPKRYTPMCETRQVYLLIAKADAQPVKEVTAPLSDKVEEAVNELANEDAQWREENPVTHTEKEVEKSTAVICSQPKKTETEIWVHQHLLKEGWEQNKFGVISAEYDGGSCNLTYVIAHVIEAFHAQFATEAGDGKEDSWQYMHDLKAAFEAGVEHEHRCTCGECDYCIDIQSDDDGPDFEEWYLKKFGHFRIPNNLVDVEEVINLLEYILEHNDGVGICLGYQSREMIEHTLKKIK